MKKIAVAALVSLVAIGAHAQMYGEVGYTMTTVKETVDGSNIKSSPDAIRAFVGYEVNPNLAIEGMVALGVGDDNIKVNGVSYSQAKLEIDHAYGIYLKPKTKLSDSVEIFGRVGYGKLKGTISVAGEGSASDSETDFSYGVGLSYLINPKTSVNVDYMQYMNKDGFKVDGLTIGVGFKF